jgi:hypothetical protein
MTETTNVDENLTDEERDYLKNQPIEEADADASPGDLSGEPTDVLGGGIDDDSDFLEEVDANDDEPTASSEGGDAR